MKIKNIVTLAGSLVVGAALAGAEPERAALPRVWTSLGGVKDAADFRAVAEDLVAHGVDVAESKCGWSVAMRRDVLAVCREKGLKLFLEIADTCRSSPVPARELRREMAVMIGGNYRGKAIDRTLYRFEAKKHRIVVEPPVYSKGQCYLKYPHYMMMGDGHYYGLYVPTGRAEIIVPEKTFDGRQHLKIIPVTAKRVASDTPLEVDSAVAGKCDLSTEWIRQRPLVELEFDLTGLESCRLDKVGIAVYWQMDRDDPRFKPWRGCYSLFSPEVAAAMRGRVANEIRKWSEANGGTFPNDVVIAARLGDEVFNHTGFLGTDGSVSLPLWGFSASGMKAWEREFPEGMTYPRTFGASEVYGELAAAKYLYRYHQAAVDYLRPAIEECHRVGIKTFRNTTRAGCWAYQNDHDGTGQELLAQALDILHLDPYPCAAKYCERTIPCDLSFMKGLSRRLDKPILNWTQAHVFMGLQHPDPDTVTRMVDQIVRWTPEAMMWLGYGRGKQSSNTFPDARPDSWERAKAEHAKFKRTVPQRKRPDIALVRPYTKRAASAFLGPWKNDPDRALGHLAEELAAVKNLDYDVFEVPPELDASARAKLAAELARYRTVYSSESFDGATAIGDGLWRRTAADANAPRTFYVDSVRGDDSAAGTSESAPWKSTARVAQETYRPGDRVLFRAGSVWRVDATLAIKGVGTESAPIVFSRYGEGPRPELRASVDGTAPGFWSASSNGLWTAKVSGKTDVGNIVCVKRGDASGTKTAAWKRWSVDTIVDEGDFCHDLESGLVYFKCSRNPSEVYSMMELCRRICIVSVGGTKWVCVDSLALNYTGAHGIIGAPVQRLRVRGCEFGWIGGSLLAMWPDGRGGRRPVRYGNGIEFWAVGHNYDIRIENNDFYEVYDTAMTNQGDKNGVLEKMVICSNRTVRCEQSYEIWFTSTNYLVKSIELFGNRFEDAGYGWSHAQRPDKNATHLLAYGFQPKVESIYYHDNHLGRTKQCMFWWFSWPTINHVRLDHNTYVQPGVDAATAKGLFKWRGEKKWFTPDFDAYRRLTGYDAHSRLLTPEEPDPAVRERLAREARNWLALPNGDFEHADPKSIAGFGGWTVTDRPAQLKSIAVADGEVRHGGAWSLRVEARPDEKIQVARNVDLSDVVFKPGRKYRIGAWMRSREGTPKWDFSFGVYAKGLRCLYNHEFASPAAADGWRACSDVFTLPANGEIIRLMFNFRHGAVGWVDDVTLEEQLDDGSFRPVLSAGY